MQNRDLIKIIEADGWYLVATKGSHNQFNTLAHSSLYFRSRGMNALLIVTISTCGIINNKYITEYKCFLYA